MAKEFMCGLMVQSIKVGSKMPYSTAKESGDQKIMTFTMESIRTIKSTEKAPTYGVMELPSLVIFTKTRIQEKDLRPRPKRSTFPPKLLSKGNSFRESQAFNLR